MSGGTENSPDGGDELRERPGPSLPGIWKIVCGSKWRPALYCCRNSERKTQGHGISVNIRKNFKGLNKAVVRGSGSTHPGSIH